MENKLKELQASLDKTKAQLRVAVKALEDVKNWDDDLEDEYGDPGELAISALQNISILNGF